MAYICSKCGFNYDAYIYNEETGRLEKTTLFSNLPETWVCPICKSPKDKFYLSQFN